MKSFATLAVSAVSFLAVTTSAAPLSSRQDTTNQNNILVSPPDGFVATVGEPFEFSYEYFSNTNPNYNSSNCRSIDVQLWNRTPYPLLYANQVLPYELVVGQTPVDGWFNNTFTLGDIYTSNGDEFDLVVIEHRYEGWSSGVADVTSPFVMQNQTFHLKSANSSSSKA
ncbi:hypothetical protein MNV49_007752 [Pseudohyphozyma bogoriensis]|nr:hypothetical protein MNV49_007752 [Pseudohyphozyma bogoriensis]